MRFFVAYKEESYVGFVVTDIPIRDCHVGYCSYNVTIGGMRLALRAVVQLYARNGANWFLHVLR